MPFESATLTIMSRTPALFQQQDSLTFDQPVGDLPVVDDARWSAALTGNSWGAFMAWIVLLIVLHAVSWPIARRTFTRLPDRGWAFSRLITLLVAGYAVWLFSSMHLISFRAIWGAVAIAGLGAISLILRRRVPLREREAPIYRNSIAMSAEIIFWVVFAVFLLFRLINPDSYHPYWGGEKAMEFAHINSILRSAHFPPIDPWYAGGFINYYYYGTYLVAFLIKLTGIPVEIAFNLAQPTFPALLASASFSMTAAIGRRITGSTFGAFVCGIAGMFFVQFAGNMMAAARVLEQAFDDPGPVDNWGYFVWDPSRAIPFAITEFPYFGALYADLHPHVIAMPFTILIVALAWQLVSAWRAIPLMVVGRTITSRGLMAVIVPLVLSSLAVGSLFMINAWDMPLFAILIAVAIFMLTAGVPGVVRRAGMTAAIVAGTGLLAFLMTIPFNMHYVALFGEIDTVREQTPFIAIETHLGGQLLLVTFGVAALMLPRAPLSRATQMAIGVSAPLLLLFFLFLQWQAHRAGIDSARFAAYGVITIVAGIWMLSAWTTGMSMPGSSWTKQAIQAGIPLVALVVLVLMAIDRPVLALYVGIGLPEGLMWMVLRRPSERFLALIIAAASLLGASLELVYLVDNLVETDFYRMNTVFKFYNQVWNLLGIATGVVVGHAIWHAFTYTDEPAVPREDSSAGHPPRIWTWLTAALAAPILLASIAYPVTATPVRLDTRFAGGTDLTLNAYAWMEYGEISLYSPEGQELDPLRYDEDLEAIQWLNENVHGSPVIAEAAFGAYRCNGSRYAIATGLPAVIGWVNHQTQQRPADDLWARESALRELYTTPDTARQLQIIDQYDVDYVVVGYAERHYPSIGNGCIDTGSPEAIASLESLEGERLESVFQTGETTIYRVIRD